MKTKINITRLLIASIAAILPLGAVYFYFQTKEGQLESGAYNLTTLPPIDERISPFLPHDQYQKLTDSVNQRRRARNGDVMNAMSFGFLGFAKARICDTCKNAYTEKAVTEYRILLSAWKLKKNAHQYTYYVQKGQSYLRYYNCGPNKSKDPRKELKDCIEIEEKIPFRYDLQTDRMSVPISERSYHIIHWLTIGYGVLLTIVTFYFVILVFLSFLKEIAYGSPFSEVNVKRLRTIAIGLLFLPVSTLLIIIIPRLVFNSYFTVDMELNMEIWNNFGKPVILSVIFAALYIAFKKGKKLQEEADLTV